LDLFKELQFSLQPRLHLEIGLLRLIQAGRLLPIEEALADLGNAGSGPAPAPSQKTTPPAPAAAPARSSAGSSWRDRLHSALVEAGMQFTADAVEHSEVHESNGELLFTTPAEFSLAMNEKDILKIVQKIAGRPLRVKITLGTPQAAAVPRPAQAADDVSERALGHPEVKRFQETFPDAQVRVVRNLKE